MTGLLTSAVFFYYFQAAKETGALQAAKNKLEKQVEELTWRLQLEKRMRVNYWIAVFYSRTIYVAHAYG